MLECCILFAHHKNDETTRYHLELLRERNTYPVVAVCNGEPDCVDRTLDVERLSKRWSEEPKWESADTVLYRWFLHSGVCAHRYIFLEWDTMATMPIREFYDEVWDKDVAGSKVARIESDPEWCWFQYHLNRLPESLRNKACGIGPLNGLLISHRALTAITRGDIPSRVFSELRIGSLIRNSGFEPCELSPEKQKMNSFDRSLISYDASQPGVYHPIKEREVTFC